MIEYLLEYMKKHITQTEPTRKWSDLKGMSPYPLLGEDAHRERLLPQE